jgi:nucleoside-diphosphate-sugar epimerase
LLNPSKTILICLKHRRFTTFKTKDLIVISGGTGWIGRSLVEQITKLNFCNPEQIIIISSLAKNIEISNIIFKTLTWENLDITSQVNMYFDLAFQTQDKLRGLGENKYIEENEKIIENSVNFIKNNKPNSIFLASSGAVYGKNYTTTPKPVTIYGELKYRQEMQISKVAADLNLNLLITRIFNISGGNINKFETFAISQMIKSALSQNNIEVFADHQVFRRYADINQLIRLILELLKSNVNCIFDSGGTLVEIRELAVGIRNIVNPLAKLELTKVDVNTPADDYYSRSELYEDLLKQYLGEVNINIDEQIMNTFNYIKNLKS